MSTNNFINGLIAGSLGSLSVYPIDVIKTRMQNQNNSYAVIGRTTVNPTILYKNGFDCCKKLWKQSGIKPFYRGCLIQMLGVAPEKAIKLVVYSNITKNNNDNIYYHILGGLTDGLCQVLVTNPYELIKINLQMNHKMNYNLLNLRKLYIGASACFLRDIPFSGIYFPTYWLLKEKFNFDSFLSGAITGVPATFLSGTIAGIPAAFLCTPADVIKTRMQTLRKKDCIESIKIIPTIKNIYYSEGFSAFWKGAGWRVLRSSPQFGITLLIFESLK